MKTIINLYTDELRPKPQRLTLQSFTVVTVLASVLMFVWIAVSVWQVQQIEQQLLTIKTKTTEQQQLNNALLAQLATLPTVEQLQKQVDEAQAQYQLRAQTLAILQQHLAQRGVDVPQVMQYLASTPIADLWFEQFTVGGEVVRFQGQAVNAQALPKWLLAIRQQPLFSGLKLDTLAVEQQQQGLTFVVGNQQGQP